jgi:hypothetical protein
MGRPAEGTSYFYVRRGETVSTSSLRSLIPGSSEKFEEKSEFFLFSTVLTHQYAVPTVASVVHVAWNRVKLPH